MSHGDATTDYEKRGYGYSLARSLVTHYWVYTVYVMAYAAFGMAAASVEYGWSWSIFAAAMGSIWFGLEGLHAVDLAAPKVTIDIHSNVQKVVGYLEVAIGGVLGVWLAYKTTWWFMAFVVAGTILGVAYNEEWFDGLLHDRDKVTGLANFGVTWGGIPGFGGYFLLAETVTLGGLLIGLAITIDAVVLNHLEGPARLQRYLDVGIESTRDEGGTGEEAKQKAHEANKMRAVEWVLLAAGSYLLFAP